MFPFHRLLLLFIAFLSVSSAYTGFCNKLQRWLLVHRVRTDPNLGPVFQHLDDIGFIRKINDIDIYLFFSMILSFAVSRYAIIAMSTEHPPAGLIWKLYMLCLLHFILILSLNIYLVFKDGEYHLLLEVMRTLEHTRVLEEPQTLKLVLFISCMFVEGILSTLIIVCVTVLNFLDNDEEIDSFEVLQLVYEQETRRLMEENNIF
ncbi:unnamed protein product [Caenorhabditis brenneri]